MNKLLGMYTIVLVALMVMITVSGCSETQQSEPEPKLLKETAAPTVAESPKAEQAVAAADKESKAEKQIKFAQYYMDLANKKKFPYDQSVAICRDVIKNNPGTEYQQQAREILRQVPEDKRDRLKITNEELGL